MLKKLILFLFGWLSPLRGVASATRESILASSDRIAGFIDVPEWGGRVYVATLSVQQRARFIDGLSKLSGESMQYAVDYFRLQVELLASGIVGADSVPLFTDADIEKLVNKSPALVGKVYDEMVRLNGFSTAAVEEVAKN